MAAAPHRSTKTSDRLQKSQVEKGTPKSRTLVTETANVTRWTGLWRMAHKVWSPLTLALPLPLTPTPNPNQNRVLEKALSEALTGSSDGVTEEDPVDPLSDDEPDSDADTEVAPSP